MSNTLKITSTILFIMLCSFTGLESCKDSKPFKDTGLQTKETPDQNFEKLPIEPQEVPLTKLSRLKDRDMESQLKNLVESNINLKKLVEQERISLGIVDFNNPLKPKYAAINGDLMMYAASLPKIAVLLTVEDAISKNQLELTPALKEDMHNMIRYSNNAATTRLIDLVGYDKIEAVLTAPRHEFYDEDRGGGLWVGKRYAASGNTNREPLKNLSHAASAHQVCRFYYNLVYGQLINKERSIDMLEILNNPGINHKFVYSLSKKVPNTSIFRKSGSWKNWHSDSVLVWDKDKKFILVALVQDSNGEQLLRNLVAPIEDNILNLK